MKEDKLVSVIMPVYNQESFLKESILSLLSQTYSKWELIVVDDGSSDNSIPIIQSIKDERIKIIQQENQGPSMARNTGIKNAVGDYIAFLDGDDLWLPEKLKTEISYIENNPDVGLVHSNYLEFNDFEERTPGPAKHFKHFPFLGKIHLTLLVFNPIATLTVLIKKEVLEKLGVFDPTLKIIEDWDLWIRISEQYSIGYIEEVLAKYRIHDAGISKNYDNFEVQYEKLLQKHLLQGLHPKKLRNKGLSMFHRHMCHGFARSFKFKKSLGHLLKLMSYDWNILSNLLSTGFLILNVFRSISKK